MFVSICNLNKFNSVLGGKAKAQFKKRENTHGGVLLTKSHTPSWVFFMFFILHK